MDLFTPPLPQDELAAQNAPQALRGNAARLERIRRRRRARRIRVAVAAAVILAGVLAYFTGLYGASLALLGDLVDSATVALTPAAGFPVSNSVTGFLNARELAGGFTVLGERELALYAPGGNELRRVQHGYASPGITVGNTRVCIYNRGSTELQVESRSRNLFRQTMPEDILLAEMSENGTLAVFTKGGLTVFDSLFNTVWEWKTSALPLSIAFAQDNKTFAVSTVDFSGGALGTKIYLFNLATSTDIQKVSTVTVQSGVPLQMKYISRSQLLVVYDTFVCIYDASTGAPQYTYNYSARTLQSASMSGKNTVLLFGSDAHASLTSLVVLDNTLSEVGSASVGSRVTGLCAGRTSVQVLLPESVVTYGLDGSFYGETPLSEPPVSMVYAKKALLFTATQILEFKAPAKSAFSA